MWLIWSISRCKLHAGEKAISEALVCGAILSIFCGFCHEIGDLEPATASRMGKSQRLAKKTKAA